MTRLMLFAAVAALPVAALAQPPRGPMESGYDPYAAGAIERADLSAAERRLERRLATHANDVPAMLNIAHVLDATGRGAGALYYYERVLGSENVRLEALDGRTVWSHDLARRGMAIAAPTAAR